MTARTGRPRRRAQHSADGGLDEKRGDDRSTGHSVGGEHAEFSGPMGDGPCGRDRDLRHADEQNGDRDQHDGAADLFGVAERRGLCPDPVGHAEHDHDEKCSRCGGDHRQQHLAQPSAGR